MQKNLLVNRQGLPKITNSIANCSITRAGKRKMSNYPSNYEHKMVTARRVVNNTASTWTPAQAGVPEGSIGRFVCCSRTCNRVNHVVLHHGEYLFKHLKCDCGHVMCQHCCSDVLKFDNDKKLRQDPVKVPPFQVEAPYFSICPNCGLTCRAKATHKPAGMFSSPTTQLTFKSRGAPCDFCNCAVSSAWPRVSIVDVEYGVLPRAIQPAARPGVLHQHTASGQFRAAARNTSLLKLATGSMLSVARVIVSRVSQKERGESFLQSALPKQTGTGSQRRRMDRDHNLPHGWEPVGYDGDTEQYLYQDQHGRRHRSSPGNRYGPWIDE